MDTGKPALGKRVLSSFFALTLVMGLVPVSAYAEVGKAQEQQGQEQSEQLVAASGENASQDAASDATQQGGVPSGSKDEAASGSASGTEAGVAESPKASGSASSSEKAVDNVASTSNGEAATQSADNGVAVQASTEKTLTYFGDEGLTKKQVYEFLQKSFTQLGNVPYKKYELAGTDVNSWGDSDDPFTMEGTRFEVKGKRIDSKYISYSSLGYLIVQKQQKSFFSWTDIAGAGVSVVSGATKKDAYYVSNDSDEVKFTVNQDSGVDTKVTRKGKNGESLSVKDEGNGTYSFKADQWSTVNVDYAVAKASLEVKFDENAASVRAFNKDFSAGVKDSDIPANTEGSAELTPKGNYAITSAMLSDGKGNKWELVRYSSFSNDRVATVTIPELEAGVSYTLKVETEECKLVLKDNASVAAKNITDADVLKQRIIAGALDVDASFPPVNPDKLTVKYNAGLGSWQNLDFVPSKWDFALHQFGKNGDTEEVRISYGGNNQYCALNAETKITIVKTATEMVVDPSSVSVPFGTTVDALKAEILKNMTVKDAVSGKAVDVADSDIAIEGYESQKAGEQTVTVSYNGSDSYDSCQAEVTVVVADAPKATLTAEFNNATVTALGNSLKEGDNEILANNAGNIAVTPDDGYAVTSVKLDGKELLAADSFNNHVATVSLPALDEGSAHALVVETKECKLALKENPSAAVGNIDPLLFEQRVIEGVLDLENSVPSKIDPNDLTIEYKAGSTDLSWRPLDYDPKAWEVTLHKFGTQKNETIHITYKGNDQYCELNTGDIEISTPDGRPFVQMATAKADAWVYNDTDENVDAAIKQAVTDQWGLTITDEAGNSISYSADDITVTGYEHKIGTYKVSVTYTDPTNKYQPTTIEGLQLEIKKVPSASFTATFNNATVQAFGIDLTSGTAADIPSGKTGTVVVTPEKGYAVTKVELDGADISDQMQFDQSSHAATINMDALVTDQSYSLTVETKKCTIAAKEGATAAVLGLTTPAKIKQRVIDGVIDFDNSVPSSMSPDDLTIEYKAGSTDLSWRDINYDPKTWEVTLHKFGEENNETIRITYKGSSDGQYCEVKSGEISVECIDGRVPTHLTVADSITVKYAPEDELKAAILASLNPQVFNDETGEAIQITAEDINVDYANFKREVGTQYVTVEYKGTEEYKPCKLENVAIKITKGNAKVTVNSQNISYGQTPDTLVTATPEEAKPIYLISGVDGNGNVYVSIDFKSVTISDLVGKDVPLVGNKPLQDVITGILGNEFSANDLLNNLGTIEKTLSALGVQDAADVVSAIRTAIEAIGKVAPGVMDSKIVLGGTPTEAGVYTIAAISVNPNYKTSVAMGYLTIAPATEDVTLEWNQELISKNMSIEDAGKFNFDVSAWQGSTDVTGKANVKVRFVGTDYEGNAYNSTTAPTKPGYYSQTAYVLGGNYFAKPISRTFNILREDAVLSLSFDGQTGDKQVTTYNGQQKNPVVTVTDKAGKPLDPGTISVGYAGITANGKIYASTKAPTEAGEYYASATYFGDATHGTSSFKCQLTIKASEVTVTLPKVHTIYGEEVDHTSEAFCQIGGGYIADADKAAIRAGITCECADGATVSGSPYLVSANIPDSVKNNKNYKITVKGSSDIGAYGLHYVEKRHASVTIDNASKAYGNDDPAFTFTVFDEYNGTEHKAFADQTAIAQELGIAVTRPDKGTEAGEAVGDHKLVGSWNSNPNYELSFNENAVLTIAERSMQVELQSASKYYGDDDPEFTYKVFDTSTAGEKTEVTDPEAIAKLGISVTRAAGDDVGHYALKGDWTNKNYAVSFSSDASLTINARPMSVVIDSTSKIYGNTDEPITYTVFDATTDPATECDDQKGIAQTLGISVTRAAGENAGDYALTGAWNENKNYTVEFNKDAKFTIEKRPTRVDIADVTKVYGEKDPAATSFTYRVFDTAVNPEVEYDPSKLADFGITVSCGDHSEDVGDYNLVGACANGNYEVTFTGKLTITPASVTVTLPYVETIYGNEVDHSDLASKVVAEGPITADDLDAIKGTVSCECGGGTPNGGTYQIDATVPDSVKANKNYSVDIKGPSEDGAHGVHYVAPRKTLVGIESASKVYGQADPDQFAYKIYDASGDATVEYTSDEATAIAKALDIKVAREAGEDVGTYALQGSWTPNGNYQLMFNVDATFTITPAEVTVSLPNIESTYGDEVTKEEHANNATITGPISDEDKAAVLGAVSCGCDCSSTKDVGTYTVTAKVPATVKTNKNYTVKVEDGTHTINPRSTYAEIQSAEKTYGENDPAFTFKVWDSSGSVWVEYKDQSVIDSMGISVTRAEGNDAGEYALSGSWTNKNYKLTFNDDAKLTIKPAEVEMVLPNITTTFDDVVDHAKHVKGIQFDSRISEADKAALLDAVTCECGNKMGADQGTYTITADVPESVKNNPNYHVTVKNGTHTIVARQMVVELESTSKISRDEEPAAQFKAWYVLPNTNNAQAVATYSGDDAANKSVGSLVPCTDESILKSLNITVSREDSSETPGVYVLKGTCNNPNYAVSFSETVATLTVHPRVDVATASEGGTVSSDVKGGPQGTIITVEATPDEGYVFDEWVLTEGDGIIADAKAAKTTITVGSENVVVKAKFAKKPDEPVTPVDPGTDPGQGGGSGSADSGNGTNAAPTEKADAANAEAADQAAESATTTKTGDSLASTAALVAVLGIVAAAVACLAVRKSRRNRKH